MTHNLKLGDPVLVPGYIASTPSADGWFSVNAQGAAGQEAQLTCRVSDFRPFPAPPRPLVERMRDMLSNINARHHLTPTERATVAALVKEAGE